jgi:uncharacterized protein (DUF58 family)
VQFLDKGVQAGEWAHLQEVVVNAKRMALPTLQVKFRTSATFDFAQEKNAITTDYYYRRDLFAVPGRKRVSRQLACRTTKRGYYTIGELDVLSRDFFLTNHYSLRLPNETALYVYPYKRSTMPVDFLCRQMMGEVLAKKRLEEDPFAFRGIRAYQPTDSWRQINWKSSAKQGELLVNMYETTTSQKICLMADVHNRSTFRQEALQELVLSIVSSLAERFLQAHIPVMVYSNGRDVLTGETVHTASGSHGGHIETIDRSLARIDLGQREEETAECLKKCVEAEGSDVCYLLVSAAFTEGLRQTYQMCREQGTEVFGIMVQDTEDVSLDREELPQGVHLWEVD